MYVIVAHSNYIALSRKLFSQIFIVITIQIGHITKSIAHQIVVSSKNLVPQDNYFLELVVIEEGHDWMIR